ncbi:tetratricopeptide repeat-containing sensor histidine kinase [Flagellimonas sp. S3867]|uniref:tetratricopeptide repeat-containing sensor histidine kinase n=1 Tax=Flagellimonas sp. S3867 TaxID=2768063 RepID=UPI0016898590|nr:tetratricopeptide repeat-containing sensor histidine kinase [Flagellimonas sp. S3867]
MKNKSLILFLLLFTCCGRQSKESNIGILSESETINKWINSARDSAQLSLERRKQYLKDAEYTANTLSNDTIRLDHLSRISLAYKKLGDSLGFRQMNLKVQRLSEKDSIFKALGESHWDLAHFLNSYGVIDSAYYHYEKAFNSFNHLPIDSTSLSLRNRMRFSMGSIQKYFKDYLGAEANVAESLRVFNDLEDYLRIYYCDNLLGTIASDMKNYNKALEYFEKSRSDLDKVKDGRRENFIRQNQNNIAFVYLENAEYGKAEKIFEELSRDMDLKSNNPVLYSTALVSFAYTVFNGKKDLGTAQSLLKEAIAINDSVGFSVDQVRAKQYLAEVLAAQNDTLKAIEVAHEALSSAKETSNNDHHLLILKLLTNLDNYNATAYSNEYYALNEKINEEERIIRDKFARIRLETDEVIEQNEVLTRQKQIWIGTILGMIVLGLAAYIIISQRASNNKLKFEQKQQESNQEIYNLMLSQQGKFEEGKKLEKKRVSEELHDGILGEMLGIRLILTSLNDKEDDTAIQQRAELIEKLREVEEEIRTISHELSNASYQKIHNFIVSIEELINTTSKSSGIECSFEFDKKVVWDRLVGDIKINAYRIVQESLQNCVKHSRCQKVDVSFNVDGNMLILVIADDGVGFDTGKGKRGIGLRNVISRVEKLNGTLSFDSEKGVGTTVKVALPTQYVNLDSPAKVEEYRQMLNV